MLFATEALTVLKAFSLGINERISSPKPLIYTSHFSRVKIVFAKQSSVSQLIIKSAKDKIVL